MIDQLHLQNLKAWRDSGAVQLAPVTMLLGSNSSGKSTLLQSLLLLKADRGLARPHHPPEPGRRRGPDDYFHFRRLSTTVLARGAAAPRQFSIALSFPAARGRARAPRALCLQLRADGQRRRGHPGAGTVHRGAALSGRAARARRLRGAMWTTSPPARQGGRSLRPKALHRLYPPRPWPCWAATARICRT